MDEIFGTTRWSEIYVILERLSTNLQQLPARIHEFCDAVCEYPDEALTEDLVTMVREARFRQSVRLEYDLVNITPKTYFQIIEYWLGDIDKEEIRKIVDYWANVAAELGGTCQIASRGIQRSSTEWVLAERWLQNLMARQKLLEDDITVNLWSIWWSDSREHLSPPIAELSGHLESILHCNHDLRQIIEHFGRFWEQLGSDIRAIPSDKVSEYRALIIASGRGEELIKQWKTITDLIYNLWTDRRRAVNQVKMAPPHIRSTGMGQSFEFSLALW